MAFAATRVLQIVKKTTGGLVWKQWPMNSTRRANVKKRSRRVAQVEAILKACDGPPPSAVSQETVKKVEDVGFSHPNTTVDVASS
ncbi:hypothetical protein GOP47_0026575 [Adiantum capillus-veneris]|nr:hypothetical protein GOP47_0026575 [Adiantum capillus-veneris]